MRWILFDVIEDQGFAVIFGITRMVIKWRDNGEYDIATVKLLLFSYNIYLFNVLFLSYKPSFVFVHESIQKRQSTARIFLSYSSLIRSSDFGNSSRALRFSPSYHPRNFPSFFPPSPCRTTMWINEHRRCFQTIGRSTQWTQVVFSFIIYLAVRNNRVLSLTPFASRNSSLVGYEKRYLGETARDREILRAKNSVRYVSGGRSRSILAAPSIAREISSFPLPFKNLQGSRDGRIMSGWARQFSSSRAHIYLELPSIRYKPY